MSLQPLLAQFLTALTGPWATGIATVPLVFTGGVLVPGEPDQAGLRCCKCRFGDDDNIAFFETAQISRLFRIENGAHHVVPGFYESRAYPGYREVIFHDLLLLSISS